LRLLAGAVGAALGPQRDLGIAAPGAGGGAAGSDSAASARRQAGGATGDEISGAGGARQRGGLRAEPSSESSSPRRILPRPPCAGAGDTLREPSSAVSKHKERAGKSCPLWESRLNVHGRWNYRRVSRSTGTSDGAALVPDAARVPNEPQSLLLCAGAYLR